MTVISDYNHCLETIDRETADDMIKCLIKGNLVFEVGKKDFFTQKVVLDIIPYKEIGEMSMVLWFEIWSSDELICRLDGKDCIIYYCERE